MKLSFIGDYKKWDVVFLMQELTNRFKIKIDLWRLLRQCACVNVYFFKRMLGIFNIVNGSDYIRTLLV